MEQSFEAVGVVERPQPGDVSLHGEPPLVVRLSLDFLGIDFDRLTLYPDQVQISPMPAPGDKVVKDNFQKLEDELQVGKGVHTIRDRLKRIRKLIEKADGPVISHGDADMLENWIDNALRKYR